MIRLPFRKTAATLGFAALSLTSVSAQDAASGRPRDGKEDDTLRQIREWGEKGKPYLPGASKPSDLPQAKIPSFPGAWGGGMYSFGGRGGKVFVVTTLDDSGPGSFREACEAIGPRIVVFNVAGRIKLKSRVNIRAPYITIAGNTAPGNGVCISENSVEINAHDVVIRHMRFRGASSGSDSVTGHPVGNIMVDHVSASWGRDENMSLYRHIYKTPGGEELKLPTVNITVQNTIFSECTKRGHEFGSTLGGHNSTFQRNLWANNTARNPSIGMDGDFTLVNNVMFNWTHRSVDGGDDKSFYTVVNNYFKPGPSTKMDHPVSHRFLKAEPRREKGSYKPFGKAYVDGNIMFGNDKVTKDNWDGGVQVDTEGDKGSTEPADVTLRKLRAEKPYDHAPLPIIGAEEAYKFVLANAGATLPARDAVDARIVREVTTGEVTYKEGKGIISDPAQVGGYPDYPAATPYKDSDSDGMPDDYETRHKLDPNNPADATGDIDGDGYTNIEMFIFGIDPDKKTDWTDLKNNHNTLDPSGGKI